MRIACGAGAQQRACDRGNRGQCLAPKAKALNLFEFIKAADFACGVAGERKFKLARRNANTVIVHKNSLHTAVFKA